MKRALLNESFLNYMIPPNERGTRIAKGIDPGFASASRIRKKWMIVLSTIWLLQPSIDRKRCIRSFGNSLESPAWLNSTMCSGVGIQFIEGLAWSLWETWTMKSARCSPGRSKGCNTYTMTSAPYPQSLANKLKSELANGRGEVRLRVKDCKDWTNGYPSSFRYVFRGLYFIKGINFQLLKNKCA